MADVGVAPQSRAELEANLAEYRSQLKEVEQLLLMSEAGESSQEMQEMYDSLTEVIQLTEELLREAIEAEQTAGQTGASAGTGQPLVEQPATGAGTSAPPASNLSTILPASVAEQIRKAQIRAALQGKAPASWLVSAPVQAKYSADGNWYDAVVEGVTADGKLIVVYEGYAEKEQVPLSELQERPEKEEEYKRVAAPKRKRVDEEAPVITEVPKWLEINEGDDAKTIERKKKLIKSYKSKMRFQNMDLATKKKADSWKDFVSGKGSKKKKGFFTGTRKESIFAVPEGINAKVGVTGSGKGMTDYQKAKRVNPAGELVDE